MFRKGDMPTPKLPNHIITPAIEGFESQKRRIDGQIAELRAMLPGGSPEIDATPETPTIKRRKFSASARRHMKQAQQRRWAKIRGESEPPAPATSKPKRKLSETGRAAIVAATKARWDRVRAAKTKPAAKKRIAAKKTAVNTAPAKAAKRAPVKKATATKKTAPAAE